MEAVDEVTKTGKDRPSFGAILLDMRKGAASTELLDALAEVAEAVQTTDKGGEVTLKLRVKPGPRDTVIITDEIKSKVPKEPNEPSMFFPDADGGLHRNPVNQTRLDFDAQTGEIR